MEVTLGRWLVRGDDADGARASVGRATWGPRALLRDLELRLGLPPVEVGTAERAERMLEAARAHASVDANGFHARSLRVDARGTATVLLRMRDELVEAGWRGDAVPGAGPRIATLAAIEATGTLGAGTGDRVARVATALGRARRAPLARVALLDPLAVWPGGWRRLFDALRERGTAVEIVDVAFPSAPIHTDLGRAQAALLGGPPPSRAHSGRRVNRDGTLVAVRAATSWELGEATAALLRALVPQRRARDLLVVRSGDTSPLDAAFVAQGMRSQGLTTSSALRPAQQVLPLALAMRFLPRDVFRALELLSLPLSPIPARARHLLLEALSESAGVGSRGWKAALAKLDAEARERVATWIEPEGFARKEGAPRIALLETASRVHAWAAACRGARRDDMPTAASRAREEALDGLVAAAGAVRSALASDGRERLAPHELDVLLAACALATPAARTFEEPSRAGHLEALDGVLRPRPVVAIWHAGADVAPPPADLFRTAERKALAEAGVVLPEPGRVLAAQAAAWRRAALAATSCLVVATPDVHLGQPQPVLPLWDEIVAGLGLGDTDVAAITATSSDLREGRATWATDAELGTTVDPLALPSPGATWRLAPEAAHAAVVTTRRLSASAVELLIGCPLRFVLERAASLRPARVATVSDGALLHGKLGHRLVEELFREGVLASPEAVRAAAPEILERLVAVEAAPLERRGRASDRAQIVRQLLRAVGRLGDLLAANDLAVEGVEVSVRHAAPDQELVGRVDVLLRDATGGPFVLDLKLGRRSYADRVRHGLAIQLAHYGEVLRRERKLPIFPPTAYFSLAHGRAFAAAGTPLVRAGTDHIAGPPVAETAQRVASTLAATRALLARGHVPVTGVGEAPVSLFDLLEDEAHLPMPAGMGCGYCDKGALCGRAWESWA